MKGKKMIRWNDSCPNLEDYDIFIFFIFICPSWTKDAFLTIKERENRPPYALQVT